MGMLLCFTMPLSINWYFFNKEEVKNDSTIPLTFFNIGLVTVQCRILGMMEHQKEVLGSV